MFLVVCNALLSNTIVFFNKFSVILSAVSLKAQTTKNKFSSFKVSTDNNLFGEILFSNNYMLSYNKESVKVVT